MSLLTQKFSHRCHLSISGDPTVGQLPGKDCNEKLKKSFSHLSPNRTYLQSDWTCAVLLAFVNKWDLFLKPSLQTRMTPFLLLHVLPLLSTQPAGTWAWDLAHPHGLIRRKCWPELSSCCAWRFLPSYTLNWCQGPDVILTHVLGL